MRRVLAGAGAGAGGGAGGGTFHGSVRAPCPAPRSSHANLMFGEQESAARPGKPITAQPGTGGGPQHYQQYSYPGANSQTDS